MVSEIRDAFFKYSPWLVLVPTILLAFKAVKPGQRILLPLLFYFIVSVITQALSLILWYHSINNLPLLHIFTFIEFFLLLWFFNRLPGNIVSDKLFGIIAVSFFLFVLIDSLYLESIYKFNIYARSLEALILIVLSFKWFLYVITSGEKDESRYGAANLTYLIAGVFIYFAGSVVLFSVSNLVSHLAYTLALNVWTIHTFLLLLFYILATVALLRWKTA